MANSDLYWNSFLKTASPETIARQLRSDEDSCWRGFLPSTLVHNLPSSKSHHADAIALQLLSANGRAMVSRDLRRLLYESLRDKIKIDIENLGLPLLHRDFTGNTFKEFSNGMVVQKDSHGGMSAGAKTSGGHPTQAVDNGRLLNGGQGVKMFSASELQTTRNVLEALIAGREHKLTNSDEISKAIRVIETQLELMTDTQQHLETEEFVVKDLQSHNSQPESSGILNSPQVVSSRLRNCYICVFRLKVSHKSYPGLCEQCGEFNLASSRISLPGNLNLAGKVALVTGGRVNLGFHTALRLLRCGARVIVSSRYPQDAASRYGSEADFEAWNHRLKILGSDFRTAQDAFGLVKSVKELLDSWKASLDFLVNNAAQTLTDSIRNERNACNRERLLESSSANSICVITDHDYEPRVRGGRRPLIEAIPTEAPHRELLEADAAHQKQEEAAARVKEHRSASELANVKEKSSWVQSLAEIPYEDFVSTFSINSLVPMILIRELLPHMVRVDSTVKSASPQAARKPVSYIVNVSSREGISEFRPAHPQKMGHHVHTNMSKAALNMITETEAATMWDQHRIAMNSVDPGYMGAAPEYENSYGGIRPIGWEDGAARVLWPVAVGERDGKAIWGRFLKHFGAVEVAVGLGR